MEHTIAANQHVLLKLPSEGMKIVFLREGGTISLGKFGTFRVLSFLGHPLGTTFEIGEDQQALPVKSMMHAYEPVENEIEQGESDVSDDGSEQRELTAADGRSNYQAHQSSQTSGQSSQTSGQSNKNKSEKATKASADHLTKYFEVSAESNQDIINIGLKIQKLDSKQIDELKQICASSDAGQKIIEHIIAGHGAFDKKTVYSQQKYLRRKQQKFLRRFQVERLGPSQLLLYYIDKDIQRVLHMSEETLGMLLSYANVRPGGNYLVLDDTAGVVVYAMLERMQGKGSILLVHENEHANLAALRHTDISEEGQRAMVRMLSWLQFAEPENEKIDWPQMLQGEVDALKPNKQLQYARRLRRAAEINDALDTVLRGNFDALVVVSTLNIVSLLPYVLPRVGGSRPVVFYSPYKEILLEAQHELMRDKRVLAPAIYETRARVYQTIQGRLHPLMTLRGYGGYVLHGTRVFPADCIQAVGKGTRKKPRHERLAAALELMADTATETEQAAANTL